MATSVEITPNANGTVEFKRKNGSEVLQTILFSAFFNVDWNKSVNEKIFDVFNGTNHFIIDYREINSTTYPTEQDFYDYLVSLSNGASTSEKQDDQIEALENLRSDFLSDVALGKITGIATFKKQGSNAAVSTTQRLLSPAGTPLVLLTTAATISFVSSSTKDKAGDTGARVLRIFGVDALGAYQTEDLILNGTTPVVTTKLWLGVLNRVQVITAGSGKTNDGVITGTSGGNTYCTMAVRTSIMKQAAFVVPSNKKALVYSYLFDASKTGGSTQVFDVFFYVLLNGVQYELFTFKIDQSTGLDIFTSRTFKTPLAFEAGTIWWVETKVASSTGWLDCEIEQLLFDV